MSNTLKWEYHIERVRAEENIEVRLKVLGAKGWELCGTRSTVEGPSDLGSNFPAFTDYYFKRPT